MTCSIADTTHLGGAPSTETTTRRDRLEQGDGPHRAASRRTDRVTISERAGECARLAGTVRALQNELQRTRAELDATATVDGPLAITPPPPTADLAPVRETIVTREVHVDKVVILPTVHTNIGSLIDVFA